MLKIKDNVDLKELEKFGFEFKKVKKIGLNYNVYEKKLFLGSIDIYPDKTYRKNYDRKVLLHTSDRSWYYETNNDALDTIFDLISAGLVEKVGE